MINGSLDFVHSAKNPRISRINLDGYYGGWPARLEIRFWHENRVLREPRVINLPFLPGTHFTYGSKIIGGLLHSGELLFSKYRWPKVADETIIIRDAIRRSRCYIEACSDPLALSVDQDCYSIGGHVHIATITPNEGFQWVSGFEPLSPSS